MRAMADGIARDQHTVRERALVLLAVADTINKEGWDDAVAAQLRRAAHDLLGMASDATNARAAEEAAWHPDH
jgi:hypothetical protein